MSSCISSCARRCSLSRSRRLRTPSTKMSARRASCSPGNKRRQGKRVREKGTPSACLFCALRAQSPAAFCLRQNRQDRRSAERRIKFLVKVQLCRTFTPLPAPRRRGLVRRTPGHLLLPFQGNSPCADERGVSFPVSPEPETYPGGTASPLESRRHGKRPPAFTDGLFHKE